MGNSNIKQQSSNIVGDGNFGGKVSAKGGVVAPTGTFDQITAQTATVSGTGAFGNILGASLALKRNETTWGITVTDKDHLCITQNGNNLTCISQEGVLY